MSRADDAGKRTIDDFGEQWTRYPVHDGYLLSLDLLADNLAPFVAIDDLKGKAIADIGSGTGRVVQLLLMAGAERVVAVEPSAAFEVLRRNTAPFADRITYLQKRGDELPPGGNLDYVVSLGVLHHIPDPRPVVAACLKALKPGGQLVVWLYGREGNELYLLLAGLLRAVTTRLPDKALEGVVRLLDPILATYVWLSRRLPLPGHRYMRNVVSRLDVKARRLTIFDQLNPAYSHYYTRDEAIALLEDGGFSGVRSHHRHGYSWLVIGTASVRGIAGEPTDEVAADARP